jgi:2-keto-4-pentenoate hydratase/2-oxohepta-3-ene-1,7-dioic acid hydratase in catechol pathway
LIQIGVIMRLATFTAGSAARIGVVDLKQSVVHDATEMLGGGDLVAIIERWDSSQAVLEACLASSPGLPLDSVTFRAPLRPVRNVFCVGKNYREHAREFGRSGYDNPSRSEDLPDKPVIFTKATTAVTGPYDDIDPHDGVTSELDYEGELAVIIGRGGRGIKRGDAYGHVWGYTIVNDVTARDLQRDHKQ